jgi:hypothetical protein
MTALVAVLVVILGLTGLRNLLEWVFYRDREGAQRSISTWLLFAAGIWALIVLASR